MTKSKIIIDYYMGASGPSIIFILKSEDELKEIRALFQKLASGCVSEVKIQELEFFQLTGFKEMLFKTTAIEKKKNLEKILIQHGEIGFIFYNDIDGWNRCVGLIDGIYKAKIPCHQYLSQENVDDALLIISFMEI